MANTTDLIEFVCSQIASAGTVHSRKMFGDHVIYLDEKPVITVCDNICYIKMHPSVEALLGDAERGFPYEGAKEHYILDIEHHEFATKVVKTLWEAIPYPKKKVKQHNPNIKWQN